MRGRVRVRVRGRVGVRVRVGVTVRVGNLNPNPDQVVSRKRVGSVAEIAVEEVGSALDD